MNWDDLKYFLAVCRHGSIRQAASRLKVSHATVSRRLKNLEKAMGEQLFERTTKGYECTSLGREIFQNLLSSMLAYNWKSLIRPSY